MPLLPTAEKLGAYSVRYTWAGTSPFDVYVNGERVLNQTTDTTLVVQYPSEATPHACEVRDANDTGTAASVEYSPRLRLQWRGQADAQFYHIQKYVASVWTTQQIASETGKGYYNYTTTAQADDTTVQWRVMPQDSRGYQGTPVDFSFFVVRNPAPPAVAYSYAAGTGLLTVSAA